jgi:hypothetical protein
VSTKTILRLGAVLVVVAIVAFGATGCMATPEAAR